MKSSWLEFTRKTERRLLQKLWPGLESLCEYAAPERHNAARLVDELIRMIKVRKKASFACRGYLNAQRYPNLNQTSGSFRRAHSLLCDKFLRLITGSNEVSATIWSSDQLHHWQRKDVP